MQICLVDIRGKFDAIHRQAQNFLGNERRLTVYLIDVMDAVTMRTILYGGAPFFGW